MTREEARRRHARGRQASTRGRSEDGTALALALALSRHRALRPLVGLLPLAEERVLDDRDRFQNRTRRKVREAPLPTALLATFGGLELVRVTAMAHAFVETLHGLTKTM